MFCSIVLLSLIFQAGTAVRPSIIAKPSEPPRRNFIILYYDDFYLFAGRHYGDSRDRGGNTDPGLFVHSKEFSSWVQILKISTAGARFGRSTALDHTTEKRLSVGWDYTRYEDREYVEQPLNQGFIAFPDRVKYDPSTKCYELRYHSRWGVKGAETVLYVSRKDIADAFVPKQ